MIPPAGRSDHHPSGRGAHPLERREGTAFFPHGGPAGAYQSYWETVFGLAQKGRVNGQGLPSLLQLAVRADVIDTYNARIPPATTWRLIRVLAPLGRARGYQASYPRFQRSPAGAHRQGEQER